MNAPREPAPAQALLPPAQGGMRLEQVDTPALLLDLDAFERNLRRLHASLGDASVRVRPHAKSHKCPQIALRQIALGAVGVCCQKVSEAEALVRGGVGDVLIANEIVGAQKLARLAALARSAKVGVCVDDVANVADLDRAAREAGTRLDVYVELNVGANRCGVEPGEPALRLAQAIARSGALRFAGIQAYQGAAQHLRSPAERRATIAKAVEKVRETVRLLESNGLRPEIVTGAGTGTYLLEAGSRVYNEIQPGSYVFMDADYGRNLGEDGQPVHEFEQSLFILATVMSRPTSQRAVVDAGLKAHSVDSGMPTVVGIAGARYVRASDEHGVIELDGPGGVDLGQKIRLIPGHCDPTVNLYDWLVCHRGDRVEDVWPISARGAFY
ncbi:MAG TPA: DSD1 family PLP-dependent enzyme [Burkholderiales bacterium]|jgi:D-serine deaminase-like pyridoxal phosphate-dependent protein